VEAVCRAIDMKPKDLFMPETRQNTRSESRIAAMYDYQDESGALLFQVVRSEPKGFRQRHPDERGEWVWNMKGVRRVLYRLPELLAADPSVWVFIAEGEKDVVNLVGVGLVATCNSGGAGKWQDEYTEALRGRRVAIIPDRDEPGWNHAENVAARLQGKAASVKVLDLGSDGVFQGKDASDWIEARDTVTAEDLAGTLVAMAEAAPEFAATQAEPAVPSLGWHPFPVDALPPACRQFVCEAADALGVDASYVALPLLAGLASAIGNTRRIALSRTWTAPAVVWAGIIGESGTLKSPAIKIAMTPIHKRQT
jgi:hypothetical protein